MAQRIPHIVVVGGGFGGLEFARAAAKLPVRITLVDQRNHHLFQPLLYQVATTSLATSEIAWPIRHLFKKNRNVTTLLGRVVGVDKAAREVVLADGERLASRHNKSATVKAATGGAYYCPPHFTGLDGK